MTNKELRATIKFTENVAKKAGAILKQGFNKKIKISYKGQINPVTEYDFKSDRYIISQIKKRFPLHNIISEESRHKKASSGYRWLIDPLDATVNYSHGFPIYCVSLALQENGRSIAGVVYDPERKELFTAGQKLGAFLNGKRISVSKEPKLTRSLLSTGFSYDVRTARKNNLGLFARMVKKAQAVRRAGSAALDLCWLASGRMDGFWELDLSPWDTAAGVLIVEEAGGKISRIDGSDYSAFNKDLLASNSLIHKQMRAVLSGTKR